MYLWLIKVATAVNIGVMITNVSARLCYFRVSFAFVVNDSDVTMETSTTTTTLGSSYHYYYSTINRSPEMTSVADMTSAVTSVVPNTPRQNEPSINCAFHLINIRINYCQYYNNMTITNNIYTLKNEFRIPLILIILFLLFILKINYISVAKLYLLQNILSFVWHIMHRLSGMVCMDNLDKL